MSKNEEVKLADCPFCGGPAAVFKTTGSGLPVQLDPQKYIVGCEQLGCCEGGRPQRTEQEAISFWNTRALSPGIPAPGSGETERQYPTLAEAYAAALAAAEMFYDAASNEEANWSGWGDQVIPFSAEMRRIKAKQAFDALRDAERSPANPAETQAVEVGK